MPERSTDLVPAQDADLTLSDRARERILAAVPENTRRAYRRQWATFETWCEHTGRRSMPATAETLAEYVVELCDAGKGPASIEQAIAVIRAMHRDAGFDNTPNTAGARRILRGHRRERAEAGRRARQAPPVTLKVLRKMNAATDDTTTIGIRDRFLLALGFAMMARRSELAALNIDDVVETDYGLEVTIRASKTDQAAEGRVVDIPQGSHPDTDPVRLYRAWKAVLEQRDITDGRLFRSVTRHGHLGQSMTGEAINEVVRAAAVRAELPNADSYTAHGLRAGGATEAYENGAVPSGIAEHGRWSPNSPQVFTYVRRVDRRKNNPMAGVGL